MEDTLKKFVKGAVKNGSLIERIIVTVKLMKPKKTSGDGYQPIVREGNISDRNLDFNTWVKTLNVSSRHRFQTDLRRGYVSRN